MKRALILVLAALVVAPSATMAAKPDYNYLEAGYNDVDVDALDEGDGFFGGGSIGFARNWHILGRYDDNEIDNGSELTSWMAGVGWHGLFSERGDLVGELFWVDIKRKNAGGVTTKEDGLGARAGIRLRLFKSLEVGAFGKWQDLDSAGTSSKRTSTSSSGFEANAIYHFSRIGIGLGWEDINDIETFNAFARLNFGKQ